MNVLISNASIAMFFIFLSVFEPIYAQKHLKHALINKIIDDKNHFERDFSKFSSKRKKLNLLFIQNSYLNNNLPNLENIDGIYLPRGFALSTGYHINYSSQYLDLSFYPHHWSGLSEENYSATEKPELFTKTNNNPRSVDNNHQNLSIINAGFNIKNKFISAGYSNWNQWWGPGVHNSLILSNNAPSFNYYFFESNESYSINNDLDFNFKYILSDKMKNKLNADFYLSAISLEFNYKETTFGYNRLLLSGGYDFIKWNSQHAALALFNGKYGRYWDSINDYFILINFPESKLRVYAEIGVPNRSFGGESMNSRYGHNNGTIIGFRKYGIFNNENLILGFEYSRLIQSAYYNTLPSSNWYDNYRYNFSSYKNRHWGAHSGPDSDDFLLYSGILTSNSNFIFAINYERHGVTYNFPPEVKLEFKILLKHTINKASMIINYENEHFKHYGFVDKNRNVWDEEFEDGSIQRTKTLYFTLSYLLY